MPFPLPKTITRLPTVYRTKAKDPVLVKFLVNERETLIPELTAVEGPYYRWEDVKRYCDGRFRD